MASSKSFSSNFSELAAHQRQQRNVVNAVLAMLLVIAVGTLAFTLLEEQWNAWDALFFTLITITTVDEARAKIDDLKQRAAAHARECGVMTYGLVCCRDTEREARELYDSIVRHGDWEATENIMSLLGIESSSFGDKDTVRNLGERFIAGWGGYPLVGTPEQVVEQIQAIHGMGIEGLILSWLDYVPELEYFNDRVMPLLRQAGLRR